MADVLAMPEEITYMSPDDVAETMEVSDTTYRELWQILNKTPKNKRKPLGSDRTDYSQGVSEMPPEPDVGLRMGDCWNQLSVNAKQNIIASAKKLFGQ